MISDNKTAAEIMNELREGCIKEFNGKWFGGLADRIEAANARERDLALKATETWIKKANSLRDKLIVMESEVNRLRKCLDRKSKHLNMIFQKALELGQDVPVELRILMDSCIVEEDEAVGLGIFSAKKDNIK